MSDATFLYYDPSRSASRKYSEPLSLEMWQTAESDIRAWCAAGKSLVEVQKILPLTHGLTPSYQQLWRKANAWGLCTTRTETEATRSTQHITKAANMADVLTSRKACHSPLPSLTHLVARDLAKPDSGAPNHLRQPRTNPSGSSSLTQALLEGVPTLSDVELMEVYDAYLHHSNSSRAFVLSGIDARYQRIIESWFLCRFALMLRNRGRIFDHELSTHLRGLFLRIEDFNKELSEFAEVSDTSNRPLDVRTRFVWLVKVSMDKGVETKSMLTWLTSDAMGRCARDERMGKGVRVLTSIVNKLRTSNSIDERIEWPSEHDISDNIDQARSMLEKLYSPCQFLQNSGLNSSR